MRGRLGLTLVLAILITAPTLPAAGQEPCADPAHPDYASHACKVTRLRARPFVVVAAIDSGINPYHLDFRLPPDEDRIGVHPSEYIEGFPAGAEALDLSFDVPDPSSGYQEDWEEWRTVRPGEARWIPGTNVIGALPPRPCSGCTDFFDTEGHGTGVASVVGGLRYGRGTPNVIVVAIGPSLKSSGYRWAARQPWIDLISISWSEISVFQESEEASREAAAAGKITCVASGNFGFPVIFFEQQGPSTNVHVGMVDNQTGQVERDSGWPNDVVAFHEFEAARYDSISGTWAFNGTSSATPHVCSLFARAISETRARIGDYSEGTADGIVAQGVPLGGYLTDGSLSRIELEDAVMSTAIPTTTTPGAYVKEGYGLVGPETIVEALKVIYGDAPRPPRPDEDRWQMIVDTAREAVWSNFPDCTECGTV